MRVLAWDAAEPTGVPAACLAARLVAAYLAAGGITEALDLAVAGVIRKF